MCLEVAVTDDNLHVALDKDGRVAIDHASGGRGHPGHGALEGQSAQGIGKGMAIAVGDVSADQVLDDVALDEHRADAAGQVTEEGRKAVVQVRVDQDLDRLGGAQGQRFERLGGGRHVVAPARHAEGEILAQVRFKPKIDITPFADLGISRQPYTGHG